MDRCLRMTTRQVAVKSNAVFELNLELYRKLYLIRRAEEKIQEHYFEGEMKTPVHLSLGKEAIEVGICHALNSQDQLFGTYRSHGIYLARSGETDAFFAELYGKETGLIKGKAGSMHLCAPECGLMVTSAIVASSIPVAVGAAYANRVKGSNAVVVVFFGDGATEEGVFWESLNIACLMKLPILFVCEDNGLAVFTTPEFRRGYNCITDIVSQYDCTLLAQDSTDAELIYHLASEAVESVRNGSGAYFLHLKYYRYLEHVGVNEDFDAGYRSKKEFEKWYARDPVNSQRTKLLELGMQECELARLEEEIDNQIGSSIRLAKQGRCAESEELYRDVIE